MAPNAVDNNSARRQPLIKIREGPLYRNMMNDKEFLKDVKDAVHKYAARVYREDSEFVGGFAKWRGHQGEGEGDDFTKAWREGGDVAYAYLCLEVFSMCERKKYSFDSAIYHVEEIKNTVNKGIKSNDRITDEKREEYRREAREWKERKDREMSDWYDSVTSPNARRIMEENMKNKTIIASFTRKIDAITKKDPVQVHVQSRGMDWEQICKHVNEDPSFRNQGPWHKAEGMKRLARQNGIKTPSKEWQDPVELKEFIRLVMRTSTRPCSNFWTEVFVRWNAERGADPNIFHPNQLRDKYKMVHKTVKSGKHSFKNSLVLEQDEYDWILSHPENFRMKRLQGAENINPDRNETRNAKDGEEEALQAPHGASTRQRT